MNTLCITFSNDNKERFIEVTLKPWGSSLIVFPNSTLIIITSYIKQPIETRWSHEVGHDGLSIWLWKGCRAKVTIDGVDVTPL